MASRLGLIHNKVARRVILLFFLSALIPIILTAVFAFTYINDLLLDQSHKELQREAKLYGMSVLDRLLVIDNKMHNIADQVDSTYRKDPNRNLASLAKARISSERQKYDSQIDNLSIEILKENGSGKIEIAPDRDHKTILYSKSDNAGIVRVYLRRVITLDKNNTTISILAELNNNFLWGDKDNLPFASFICVTDSSGIVLFCPYPDSNILLNQFKKSGAREEVRAITWTGNEGKNLAVAWDLFTQSRFTGKTWQIITSKPETEALSPVYAFRKFFPGVIAFSILVVLLLSMMQIRRSMLPLKQLVMATRRLANYEFGEVVDVKSDDEFKELADSFNTMADRLKKQFSELEILSEIDTLLLTYPDMDVVISRIFDSAKNIIPCDFIAITLVDKTSPEVGFTYIKEMAARTTPYIEKTVIPTAEADKLLAQGESRLVDLKTQAWHILEPLAKYGIVTARICPIRVDEKLRAIFSLGYRTNSVVNSQDAGCAHGIIDRLGVALATTDRDEKLYHQAHYDHLTGLPNRKLFNERLDEYINNATRRNEHAALLYINLDRFKNINDTLGHTGGDKLLLEVGERLRNYARPADIISRLGGDEFAILLTNISSGTDAISLADNISKGMLRPFQIQSREIFVNISIGIAVYPADGNDGKTLLAHADAALYHAKERGRGRYMFFEDTMNQEIMRRMELETAMRHALSREQFTLYYQPKIDLRTGSLVGVEALIRWNHPELGFVRPDQFIPIAEECGLIEPIGDWVLRTACAQFKQWRGMNISPARLAVNISSRQFMQADFVDSINKIIISTGMLPDELELEITESLLMDLRINTKLIFSELATMGVRIAIDDFGTGYSSLGYLKRFPVHTLKIDRSFIHDIPADTQATTLTLSIIAMAQALNMEVIAEGVESKQQIDVLRSSGCNFVQGFYYYKPTPADEMTSLLMQQASNQPSQPD